MKFLMATILAGTVLLCADSSAYAQRGARGGGGYRGGYSGGSYYGGGYSGRFGYPGYGGYYGSPYGYSSPWGSSRYNYGYVTPYYGGSYSYGSASSYPPTTTYYPPATTTAPAAASDSNAVNMEVRLPENATLWVEGQQLNETGAVRNFVSPPLAAGKTFVYNLKASWTGADGKAVEKTKQVDVKAGSWVGVDFNRPD